MRLGLLFHNFWILSSLLLSEKNMLTFVIPVFDHHVKSAVFLLVVLYFHFSGSIHFSLTVLEVGINRSP